METYNDEEVRYETKEDIFKDTDENVPTNNVFKITAKMIRHTLKSIVESLWHKTYIAKTSDYSDKAYVYQDGQYYLCSSPYNTIHVPKCDTLIIPKEILNSSNELMRIEMDNVENGYELTLFCKTKIVGIGTSSMDYGYFTNGGQTDKEIELVKKEVDHTSFYIDINGEKKVLETFSNIAMTGSYSGMGGSSYLTHFRNMTQYPLKMIYWEGIWYPVNIY